MADFNFDIWRLQAQGDVRGLMTLLRHANPDIRRRSATALRALGATSAIPGLQAALVTEGDGDVRNVLVSALDYLFEQALNGEDNQAVDRQHKVVFWIAQLSSDKPEHIIRAAQSLAELKEKIAVEALVLVFRNRQHSARVRLAAAEALLKLESAPVEITLLAALRHQDWHTRRNAAGVLGQLHADWAVEPLAAALRDPSDIVRRTAYAALKRIDTPEAHRAMEPPISVPKGVTKPLSSQPVTSAPQPAPQLTVPTPPAPTLLAQPLQPAASATQPTTATPVPTASDPLAPLPQPEVDTKPLIAASETSSQPEPVPAVAPVTAASSQTGIYMDEETQPTKPILGEDTV